MKKKQIKLLYDSKSLTGYKTLQKIIYYTNKICSKKLSYVEIGVFRGNSIMNNSINSNHNIQMYGIDNFAFFGEPKKNYHFVKKQIKKNHLKNITILKADYEKALDLLKKKKVKIGVLFIDGPHDYRSQLISLIKYSELLDDNAVIIIDDANYYHVRKANNDFLNTNKNYKLIYQNYSSKHIANCSNQEKDKLKKDYLNGINIIINKKNRFISDKQIPIKYPKNEKFLRNIFIDSHEVFRHYYAYNCSEILNLVFDYRKNYINKNTFIKEINKIKIAFNLKNKRLFKSQNLF